MQLYRVGGSGNKILSNTMQHQTKTASILISLKNVTFSFLRFYRYLLQLKVVPYVYASEIIQLDDSIT